MSVYLWQSNFGAASKDELGGDGMRLARSRQGLHRASFYRSRLHRRSLSLLHTDIS